MPVTHITIGTLFKRARLNPLVPLVKQIFDFQFPQNLGLKGNPLSPEILSVYNEVNGTSRLLSYMLDNLGVTASQPNQRPWTTLAQPDRQRVNLLFTCMSYNVLCDKYATRQVSKQGTTVLETVVKKVVL